jgi:hypothetical protein
MKTPRSTTWFIDYELRPSKQLERKIVFESIRSTELAGVEVSDLRYLGMGGYRFVDFLVARRILGTSIFTSLERDKKLLPRCQFNKPFEQVDVVTSELHDYLETNTFPDPMIAWLDFESPVNRDVRTDASDIAIKVQPGSFVFVTALGEIHPRVTQVDERRRREYYVSQFGGYAGSLKEPDFGTDAFPTTAAKLLQSFLVHAFGGRKDGSYFPYLTAIYKDTTWMVTAGGYFGSEEMIGKLQECWRAKFDFLSIDDWETVFRIPRFNITDAEKRLFDSASLPAENSPAMKLISKLGFNDEIVQQYGFVARHVPRYFETYL